MSDIIRAVVLGITFSASGSRLRFSPFSDLDFIDLPEERGAITALTPISADKLLIDTQYAQFELRQLDGTPETTWCMVRLQ